jgi:hypothetical protein
MKNPVFACLFVLCFSAAQAAITHPVHTPQDEEAEYAVKDEIKKEGLPTEYWYRSNEETSVFIGGDLVMQRNETEDGLVLTTDVIGVPYVVSRRFDRSPFSLSAGETAEAQTVLFHKQTFAQRTGTPVQVSVRRMPGRIELTYTEQGASGRTLENSTTYREGSRLPDTVHIKARAADGKLVYWVSKTRKVKVVAQ